MRVLAISRINNRHDNTGNDAASHRWGRLVNATPGHRSSDTGWDVESSGSFIGGERPPS